MNEQESPYYKDWKRPLIQHSLHRSGWIVWNWDTCRWDKVEHAIVSDGLSQTALSSTNGEPDA